MADQSINIPISRHGTALNIVSWILCVLLAFVFVLFGGAKLFGVPATVREFDNVGLGQWFRYFTGIIELTGGVGVLIPRYSRWAALLLVVVMCGALVAHFTVLRSSPAAAITMLVIALLVVWLRK